MFEIAIYLVIGFILLYYGADWLIKGACSIAFALRISQLIVGLTVVSYGTSAPELIVSLKAAIGGYGDISLGNIIGSNIANICLVLGLSAMINPLKIQKQILNFDILYCIAVSVILYFFLYFDQLIGRFEGLFFVLLLIFYLYLLWRKSLKERGIVQIPDELNKLSFSPIKSVFLLLVGMSALVGGGHFFVEGAVKTARLFGLSDALIGLTVVAVGTSLPELAASLVASIKKKDDISVGNIIGSNIFNICLIVGLTSFITPIHSKDISGQDFVFMLGSVIILYPIMWTGRKITRAEGFFLFTIYVVYIYLLIRKG